MSLLEVDGLSVVYGEKAVVDNLSFQLDRGESLGLVGESGAGKTQAALALMGLAHPAADVRGDIRFDGQTLTGLSERELNRVRATRIAMVFQDPLQALNPYVRVGDQLARILIEHRLADGRVARDRVIAMLERVGLAHPERQFSAFPHELSGGMRQRAMIAAALVTEPDVLIADEPTTALDVTVQAQILELLEALRDDTALLLITHDLGVVSGHCERTLVMSGGQKVEEGNTRSLFLSPSHPHTQAMVDAAPRLGAVPSPPRPRTEPVLRTSGLDVDYGEHRAVQSAELTLLKGETLAIVGESGSGKSSLVRAVLGLLPASAGEVVFLGRRLGESVAERRGMTLVFQDPIASLNPQMRVRDSVAEPLRARGEADVKQRVIDMLQRVGLDERFLERYPHQLSGGQAQRVAIARAVITSPDVLVCDEAVAALDGRVRRQILELLSSLQAETGLSIVFISHDLATVEGFSHRVMVMHEGRVVEVADATELFARPVHAQTRALLAAVPSPDPAA
ncbi:MAG: ABC transporter ATP-binding protein [Pseudomonadota bacterium]